jgi:antirestriction protein
MLNIYINTWGNYNENGADGGEWVTLPTEEGDLKETLDRIAKNMGDFDPEFFINDYEWVTEISLRDIDENENIEKLNEEMQALDALTQWEQETFCAAVEVFGYNDVSVDDISNFALYKDITNDYDLGYYWAVESGCYDLDKMGSLSNYIDYEAFGRDIRFESDGAFSSLGWVERC